MIEILLFKLIPMLMLLKPVADRVPAPARMGPSSASAGLI